MVNWADFIKHLRRMLWQHSPTGYYNLVETDYSKSFCLMSDGQIDSLGMAEIGLDLELEYNVDLAWHQAGFPAVIKDIFDLINAQKTAA